MRRILLALLAVLAGILTQATPVAARINAGADIELGVVETTHSEVRCASVQSPAPLAPIAHTKYRSRIAGPLRGKAAPISILSVLFGADRAFE